MDLGLWPFMFFCLNGCYGPPQTLRGQVERLPEAPVVSETRAAAPTPDRDDEALRLARAISDPLLWAERIFAAGRPDLTPTRLLELNRRGIPAAHLDALHARELRAREADCAGRVAEHEQRLSRRHDDESLRRERVRPVYPAYPGYPFAPAPPYPYPGGVPLAPWPYWR